MGEADDETEARRMSEPPAQAVTLELAKKFLEDDEVRLQSRERKIEFLKTKGFQEAQITEVLGTDDAVDAISKVSCSTSPAPAPIASLRPLRLTRPRKAQARTGPQGSSSIAA